MKFLSHSLCAALITCSSFSTVEAKDSQTDSHTQSENEANRSALELINRVVPQHAHHFIVDTSLAPKDGKNVFRVSDQDGKILLQGDNGVSVASALYWYLKNRTACDISWCGDQLDLPVQLPKVGDAIELSTLHNHRVNFNYCTLSYSGSFWDWDRWQREIDFMAMQGINMPLAAVGLEAVWYNTLTKLGWTDIEARSFLVGPAYQAWQWMTNIEGIGGPLPKTWIDSRAKLGKQIIDRQRALGMTPIQQGFTGFVPLLSMKKFPDANIAKSQKKWGNISYTAQLDPLDPLFKKFGKTFLAEQEQLFGTSHYYGCDPFHEGKPPVEGDQYLVAVGKEIDQLLKEHDPKSICVMQSWSIRKAIATAFEKERMLIVDLGGKRHVRYEEFWGYDFVSGRLHNFGARINLHGDLANLSTNPFAQIPKEYKGSAGMGMFMEGITQNPVYYALAYDMIWRDKAVDLTTWLEDYATRRYGAPSDAANQAWQLLLKGPYKENTDGVEKSSIIAARPAIHKVKSGPNAGIHIPYNPLDLLEAWSLLLSDSDKLKASQGYQYEVVDIGRQVLSNHGQDLFQRIREAYESKDLKAFRIATNNFYELLSDVDTLLATRTEFSFGKWVSDARALGTTAEEKDLYEHNARSLVTVWGPPESPLYFDYAWKEWSGLISTFYLPRWKMFHAEIEKKLINNEHYNETDLPLTHSRQSWRANDIYEKLADFETGFTYGHAEFTAANTSGDSVVIAQAMFTKYAANIEAELNKSKSAQSKRTKDQQASTISEWLITDFDSTKKSSSIEHNITSRLDGSGTYEIKINYTKGRGFLDVTEAQLLANGKVISTNRNKSSLGSRRGDGFYQLKLDEHAFGTEYTVKITARVTKDKSTDELSSQGAISLNKIQ